MDTDAALALLEETLGFIVAVEVAGMITWSRLGKKSG
jgi:hypothetical protein